MSLIAFLALLALAVPPLPASAWNIPGHLLSGIIAYQVLQQENPATIEKVKAVLEKHPWYGNQWQARFQDVPIADHSLVLFMQAARCPIFNSGTSNTTRGPYTALRRSLNKIKPDRSRVIHREVHFRS